MLNKIISLNMGAQEILVALLFIAALCYFGRSIYNASQSKSGCASGCNKCGVDFSEVKPPKL